jgi:hypothetical protein
MPRREALSRRVLIEQFHIDVRVPASMPEAESKAVRRALASRAFKADLLRAVRAAAAARPELRKATLALTK